MSEKAKVSGTRRPSTAQSKHAPTPQILDGDACLSDETLRTEQPVAESERTFDEFSTPEMSRWNQLTAEVRQHTNDVKPLFVRGPPKPPSTDAEAQAIVGSIMERQSIQAAVRDTRYAHMPYSFQRTAAMIAFNPSEDGPPDHAALLNNKSTVRLLLLDSEQRDIDRGILAYEAKLLHSPAAQQAMTELENFTAERLRELEFDASDVATHQVEESTQALIKTFKKVKGLQAHLESVVADAASSPRHNSKQQFDDDEDGEDLEVVDVGGGAAQDGQDSQDESVRSSSTPTKKHQEKRSSRDYSRSLRRRYATKRDASVTTVIVTNCNRVGRRRRDSVVGSSSSSRAGSPNSPNGPNGIISVPPGCRLVSEDLFNVGTDGVHEPPKGQFPHHDQSSSKAFSRSSTPRKVGDEVSVSPRVAGSSGAFKHSASVSAIVEQIVSEDLEQNFNFSCPSFAVTNARSVSIPTSLGARGEKTMTDVLPFLKQQLIARTTRLVEVLRSRDVLMSRWTELANALEAERTVRNIEMRRQTDDLIKFLASKGCSLEPPVEDQDSTTMISVSQFLISNFDAILSSPGIRESLLQEAPPPTSPYKGGVSTSPDGNRRRAQESPSVSVAREMTCSSFHPTSHQPQNESEKLEVRISSLSAEAAQLDVKCKDLAETLRSKNLKCSELQNKVDDISKSLVLRGCLAERDAAVFAEETTLHAKKIVQLEENLRRLQTYVDKQSALRDSDALRFKNEEERFKQALQSSEQTLKETEQRYELQISQLHTQLAALKSPPELSQSHINQFVRLATELAAVCSAGLDLMRPLVASINRDKGAELRKIVLEGFSSFISSAERSLTIVENDHHSLATKDRHKYIAQGLAEVRSKISLSKTHTDLDVELLIQTQLHLEATQKELVGVKEDAEKKAVEIVAMRDKEKKQGSWMTAVLGQLSTVVTSLCQSNASISSPTASRSTSSVPESISFDKINTEFNGSSALSAPMLEYEMIAKGLFAEVKTRLISGSTNDTTSFAPQLRAHLETFAGDKRNGMLSDALWRMRKLISNVHYSSLITAETDIVGLINNQLNSAASPKEIKNLEKVSWLERVQEIECCYMTVNPNASPGPGILTKLHQDYIECIAKCSKVVFCLNVIDVKWKKKVMQLGNSITILADQAQRLSQILKDRYRAAQEDEKLRHRLAARQQELQVQRRAVMDRLEANCRVAYQEFVGKQISLWGTLRELMDRRTHCMVKSIEQMRELLIKVAATQSTELTKQHLQLDQATKKLKETDEALQQKCSEAESIRNQLNAVEDELRKRQKPDTQNEETQVTIQCKSQSSEAAIESVCASAQSELSGKDIEAKLSRPPSPPVVKKEYTDSAVQLTPRPSGTEASSQTQRLTSTVHQAVQTENSTYEPSKQRTLESPIRSVVSAPHTESTSRIDTRSQSIQTDFSLLPSFSDASAAARGGVASPPPPPPSSPQLQQKSFNQQETQTIIWPEPDLPPARPPPIILRIERGINTDQPIALTSTPQLIVTPPLFLAPHLSSLPGSDSFSPSVEHQQKASPQLGGTKQDRSADPSRSTSPSSTSLPLGPKGGALVRAIQESRDRAFRETAKREILSAISLGDTPGATAAPSLVPKFVPSSAVSVSKRAIGVETGEELLMEYILTLKDVLRLEVRNEQQSSSLTSALFKGLPHKRPISAATKKGPEGGSNTINSVHGSTTANHDRGRHRADAAVAGPLVKQLMHSVPQIGSATSAIGQTQKK